MLLMRKQYLRNLLLALYDLSTKLYGETKSEVLFGQPRDVRMGVWGHGGVTPPMFSNLPESWLKVSLAARELATAFS